MRGSLLAFVYEKVAGAKLTSVVLFLEVFTVLALFLNESSSTNPLSPHLYLK